MTRRQVFVAIAVCVALGTAMCIVLGVLVNPPGGPATVVAGTVLGAAWLAWRMYRTLMPRINNADGGQR